MLKLMLLGETRIERDHFSNVSRFNLLGSDGKQFVRRVAG